MYNTLSNIQGSIKIYKLPLPRDLDDHTIMGLDPQGGFFQVREDMYNCICHLFCILKDFSCDIFSWLNFVFVLNKTYRRAFRATSQSECWSAPMWWRPTTCTPWTSTARPTPTSSSTLGPRGFLTRRTMSPSNSILCLESEFLKDIQKVFLHNFSSSGVLRSRRLSLKTLCWPSRSQIMMKEQLTIHIYTNHIDYCILSCLSFLSCLTGTWWARMISLGRPRFPPDKMIKHGMKKVFIICWRWYYHQLARIEYSIKKHFDQIDLENRFYSRHRATTGIATKYSIKRDFDQFWFWKSFYLLTTQVRPLWVQRVERSNEA